MESIISFLFYWSSPILMSKYLLPPQRLLLMSPFQSLVMPYLVIAAMIFVITVLFNVVKAIRTCPIEPNKPRSLGFLTGVRIAIFASLYSTIMYLIVNVFPELTSPFLAISILPYATEIGKGLYIAMAGMLGYWFGRLFTPLC